MLSSPPIRSFKFHSFWLSDPSFPSVVQQAWGNSSHLLSAIDTFSRQATTWNREHFGNIFWKKRKLLAHLEGIQRSLGYGPSSFLVNLERVLLRDLDCVLNQEEALWATKSRINWTLFGDRNTSFNHVSTLVRRRRNQILAIKNNVGDWLYDETDVKEFIREGFLRLHSSSHSCASIHAPTISAYQPRISDEDRVRLESEVTEADIKRGLWSLKAWKAPGPRVFLMFLAHNGEICGKGG